MKLNKTVFVNGCFDLLHPGHVFFLKEASEKGNRLIVGINSDDSVKKLKGKLNRSLEERKFMLEACKFVNLVVSFNQDTATGVVEFLRPDVYVTGDEYRGRSPEARLVKEYGGQVVYVTRLGKYSSSILGGGHAEG
jgi:D-beta-D-heptose 7-phosphate kinase/D-beta-D-heptose 1-phosphate adenosyltransferase